jgi:pimeloyl-ACP methyl ester carboxylesterase
MNNTHTKETYKVKDQSVETSRECLITCFVTSKDGTRIEYRKCGHGPGVVMLHGAMESARSHMRLAEELADTYTVYLPERRGHHRGVPFVTDYSMQKEVQDLEALLEKTGTHNIFGVSAGGLICLEAARTLSSVHKVALYEPALVINGFPSMSFLPRYDREITQGKIAAGLISGMKGAHLGAQIFNIMPRWLLELITTLSMKEEAKTAKPGDVMMRDLAPTLHYDFQLVAEMAESLESFETIQSEVLLLGGSKSPNWLKVVLDNLERTVPYVKRIELAGLDHGGSSDISSTNRFGKPEIVAAALRRFFAES